MKHILLVLAAIFALGSAQSQAADYKAPRTVMPNLLVGAGVPKGYGGKSLPESKLKEYCSDGFTTAFYLYPGENFTTRGRYSCSGNNLNYTGGGFRKGEERVVLEAIYNAANKGGKVLIHCWNGSHATGEVAAKALMQFCGWSGREAGDYWKANIHDKSNLGKYGSIVNRIKDFQTYADLKFTSAQKSRFCP